MNDPVRDEQHLATEEETPVDEAEEAVPTGEGRESAPEAGEAGEGAQAAEDLSVKELREQLSELEDRHLRLAAEFTNFRRRSEQERIGIWQRAQADLVGKILEVLDDLSRVAGLDLSNADAQSIMEGVDLVERKFVRILGELGVEVIDPVGQPFDPERMEAMMRVEAESPEQDDVVAQVVQKGYALGGVLVRPARVAVYKQG